MARDRQPVLKKCRTLGLDPSILGGVVLQVEDRVIDGSVKNKLKKIRAQIIDKN